MSTQTRRRRPEARPDEILDAALSVFAEQGFTAARVEDIARRAGLSKGAVYLYFPSKEAMLNALVEQSAVGSGCCGVCRHGRWLGMTGSQLHAIMFGGQQCSAADH